MSQKLFRTVALSFLVLPLVVLAGCMPRGFSPETVRQIREIDKAMCDIRIDLALSQYATVAPAANDQGMIPSQSE